MKTKRTKVAIVANSASKEHAPYKNKNWDVWALNEMPLPRYDVMFELHPLNLEVQKKEEIEFLRKCRKPVYVLNRKDAVKIGIRKPIEYPLKDILSQPWAMDYFCCTMAYQVALAIYKDYQMIGLWGLNMDRGSPRERTIESACMQWWLGVAKGRGIKVLWPDHPANRRLRYGYDYWEEIECIDAWLYKLTAHSIFRLGVKHLDIAQKRKDW